MAKADHYKERYGDWAGNPEGHKPDMKRCCEEVHDRFLSHQCSKPCGHGPDGAYCKQHDPAAVAERKSKSKHRYREKHNKLRYEWNGRAFYLALKQIAEGHNDARGFAQSVIEEFDKGSM